MPHDNQLNIRPARPGEDAPLPDPRRLMALSIIAIVVLAFTVIAAAFYAVQTLDRVAIAGEVERAKLALALVGTGPDAAMRLSAEFVLEGARFVTPGDVAANEVSVAVPAVENTVLAWTPRRIGTSMFYHLAPLRIAACALFLAGIVVVLRRLYGMTRELERRRREAAELAERDPLTGLGNRLAFDNWLARAAKAEPAPVGLLYIDLDGFKQINDSMGHGAGDDVLRIVAGRILRLAGPNDLVVRMGGDEFAFVRPSPVSRMMLAELAADIGTTLGEPVRLGTTGLAVGASVGIAIGLPGDSRLVASADAALYRAKALPGHTFVFSEAA